MTKKYHIFQIEFSWGSILFHSRIQNQKLKALSFLHSLPSQTSFCLHYKKKLSIRYWTTTLGHQTLWIFATTCKTGPQIKDIKEKLLLKRSNTISNPPTTKKVTQSPKVKKQLKVLETEDLICNTCLTLA